MVVTEIDGVVLRRQRSKGTMQARIAVAYSGKRVVSVTARHRKRIVTGKVGIRSRRVWSMSGRPTNDYHRVTASPTPRVSGSRVSLLGES